MAALLFILVFTLILQGGRSGSSELVCRVQHGRVTNRNLCLHSDYNKFELPIQEGVNIIDIGIDITDVLRINDKEYGIEFSSYFNVMWREPRLHIPAKYLLNVSHVEKDVFNNDVLVEVF